MSSRQQPGRTLVLALVVAAAWTWTGIEALGRTSFFDDAFIYLAIARNVVEAQTAQLFPIVDNAGLVASSPLRLLLLVPSHLVATAVHGSAPAREVATLAFLVSGVLTALLFLPFHRRRIERWLAMAALAGLASATTNSMLQMEGALVFWGTGTLVFALADGASPRRLGLLLALLCLSRVEFGVAAAIALAVAVVARRSATPFRDVRTVLVVLGAVAIAWVVVATALGVWPVPTTFLTKVHTGAIRMFGPPFARTFAETLANYLPLPTSRDGQRFVVACGGAICVALLAWRPAGRIAALVLVAVAAILARGPGNFVWYHENVLLAAVASLIAVCAASPRSTWRVLLGAAAVVLVVANACARLGDNDRLPWALQPPPAYGGSLVWLAERHAGNGTFHVRDPASDGATDCFVAMTEIGIVSYFAGPTCWLFDAGGLAQAGQLPGVAESWLALVYPSRVLRTGPEELAVVRAMSRTLPLYEPHFVATRAKPERAFLVDGAPWAFRRLEPR
jgi:hypothetical protein